MPPRVNQQPFFIFYSKFASSKLEIKNLELELWHPDKK
jgi:hypothetical protein